MARSWAIGTASTVCARSAWNTWRASRSAPAGVVRSPTPTAITPGASSSTSPPSTCSCCQPWILRVPCEARVGGVDQLGQLGLAGPGGHRQGRDRDSVADPDAGVAGEEQVGQRVDQEVVAGQQAGDQAEAAAHLVVADAGGEVAGRARRAARPRAGRRDSCAWCRRGAGRRARGDRVVARLVLLEGLGEQVGQVEHLDAAAAQRLGERVVLVLRPADPRDPVEQQAVVVARGEPLQLGPGTVQHHRPQPADLAVGAVGRVPALANSCPCGNCSRARLPLLGPPEHERLESGVPLHGPPRHPPEAVPTRLGVRRQSASSSAARSRIRPIPGARRALFFFFLKKKKKYGQHLVQPAVDEHGPGTGHRRQPGGNVDRRPVGRPRGG